ncbi:pilus biosynthesis protein TadE, partial [Mycobacterium sp. ITM-2017-0098]
VAPADAVVDVRRDGQFVVARVTARSALLPGLSIAGEAMAAAEHRTG